MAKGGLSQRRPHQTPRDQSALEEIRSAFNFSNSHHSQQTSFPPMAARSKVAAQHEKLLLSPQSFKSVSLAAIAGEKAPNADGAKS